MNRGKLIAYIFCSVFIGLGFCPSAFAAFEELFPIESDARTAAIGYSTFAAPSEKNEFNLFNLGNPSGAVFLPVENRLDYGVRRHEDDAWPSQANIKLAGTGGAYQGVLLRPSSQAVFQIGSTAETYTHTYGDSRFYEGQRVHALAAGSLLGAYEVIPGLGIGIKYRYARPVQEVYSDKQMQQESDWELGIGYQFEESLTFGINGGYQKGNQSNSVLQDGYYIRTRMPNGNLVLMSESWSIIRSTVETTFDQPYGDIQLVYKPFTAFSVICIGEYLHGYKFERVHRTYNWKQRVTGTGNSATDYTSNSASSSTDQTENIRDIYTVWPMVQLRFSTSEDTRLDLGVHFKYEYMTESYKRYTIANDPIVSVTSYDDGKVTQSSANNSVEESYGITCQNDSYEYVLGTWSWHSREREFLIGGQYEHQKNSNTFSVGGEYWLFSALAVRLGTHIYSTTLSQANTYTAGLGWEGDGYTLNFSYSWYEPGYKLYVQNMGLGVTVYL